MVDGHPPALQTESMAISDDATNFDVIEDHKENIQALPGGRSARKLAQILSPAPLNKLSSPTLADTKNVNDCIRTEYEAEIENISESDDPLDVYDRYVRWTLDAYPSAQATPESQLHTLLERATQTFVHASQYKSDPRYLKLWMYYIQFFSDSPRETYMFLSRHGIGETLALFYEEYAAWLEGAGRWSQAEEVYKLGIAKDARPVQRLLRKFKEFEQRLARLPEGADEPSSPALPSLRPALAAKVNPFESSSQSADPQAAPRQPSGIGAASAKPKSKLAIFSDADAQPSAMSSRDTGSKGWDTIGSLTDRKKENEMEPKPWAGETLKAGGKKSSAATKISVFRDPSLALIQNIVVVPSKHQVTVHPYTGKKEYIFVNLSVIYPSPEEPGTELSFEEIMAFNRGWLNQSWDEDVIDESLAPDPMASLRHGESVNHAEGDFANKAEYLALYDENGAMKGRPREPRTGRKEKFMEVNETQIIKAKLDSPSRPKLRKKNTSEPTMTLHTRAATDDIYEIFNAPLRSNPLDGDDSGDGEDFESDDNFTTDGESTGTTKMIDPNEDEEEEAETKSEREWSMDQTRQQEVNGDVVGSKHARDGPAHTDKQASLSKSRTTFIPIPPEDYEPPTRPYRDPVEAANNRLPFMTPITERTESSSLDVDPALPAYKTPCRRHGISTPIDEQSDLDPSSSPLSSPLRDILTEELSSALRPISLIPKDAVVSRGPIIKESQCNPVDDAIRQQILAQSDLDSTSFSGFHDHRLERYKHGSEIRRFAKALSKAGKSADKVGQPVLTPIVIEFADCSSTYTVERELGAGAFAPVYLVERSSPEGGWGNQQDGFLRREKSAAHRRGHMEALKMESPPTSWEFYMMRLAHSRLGPQNRVICSLSYAHEFHLYQDEAFLFLPFHPHGTLLDVINLFRSKQSGVMDEQLAMFFSIELLRTVEALHSAGVLHGDLKPDNCLLRLDSLDTVLQGQWRADGGGGWETRGVVLIDFGRGIDIKAFAPNVEFIADWKPSVQDCPEIHEGRPWTWQIDYFGLAGIIHCLLFGKYIETMQADNGGLGRGGRRYRIRENLKRYWQTDIWTDCFEILLNPSSFVGGEDGGAMPVLKSMRNIRERMESWLEMNCEKGVGLKSLFGKVEEVARSRK